MDDVNGYLRKIKSSSFAKIFGGTNLRWFMFLHKDRIIAYQNNEKTGDNLKGKYRFEDIVDFIDRVITPIKEIILINETLEIEYFQESYFDGIWDEALLFIENIIEIIR